MYVILQGHRMILYYGYYTDNCQIIIFSLVFQSPSTLSEEKLYNPFLRTHVTSFVESLGFGQSGEALTDEKRAAALKLIRERKDKFKYKL